MLPDVKVDSKSINIVLDNLLNNAIEALREAASKQLTIVTGCRKETDSDMVEIVVTDSGCGLSEPELQQIFQPFYTTRENGIGLGLSIVARVIEQHEGLIKAESEIGRGTTFKVTLPC
jgi:signal transduction histidine kinase